MKEYTKIGYRDIAKMLVKALPVEGQDFADKVNDYLKVIKRLPQHGKIALKQAYVFSRKVPKQEREDLFQELALTLLKAQVKDERLAYAIARCDWKDWWKRYTVRQHYSLDMSVIDNDGNQTTLGDLIVGECEFEAKINGRLDTLALINQFPPAIKRLVIKRLTGRPLAKGEGQLLERWGNNNLQLLASLS